MNKIYSLFLLVIVLCLGCSSDDNGTNPNGNIVYDDWYWELTIDTITYRCEGTFPKSGSFSIYQDSPWDVGSQDGSYLNMPYYSAGVAGKDIMVFGIESKATPNWVFGDLCRYTLEVGNPPAQPEIVDAYFRFSNLGEGVANLLQSNDIDIINTSIGFWGINGNDWGTNQPTSGGYFQPIEDHKFQLDFKPGSFNIDPSSTSTSFNFEFAEGSANFTLFFKRMNNQGYLQVPCSFRFKSPPVGFD